MASHEKKRILVTGGAGFIGTNLVKYLVKEVSVDLVVNLDKLTYAGNPENLKDLEGNERHIFVKGDVGDKALVGDILKKYEINGVMHLAAESHVDRSIDDGEVFVETNVLGTMRLLETCREYWEKCGKKPFRFLNVSTDEVYGSLQEGEKGFHEGRAYAPNSPYAASKAGGDHLVRAYGKTYGLPILITNCSNNYGPYQFPEKLIPLMILNCVRGKELPIYGDGKQVRDWLYVGDHCRALWNVFEKGRIGKVYHIGGGCEIRNRDVVEIICEVMGELRPKEEEYEESIRFVEDRPGHDVRYAMDWKKIKEELGWSPQMDFKNGLRQTVAWYLEHLDWCEKIEQNGYCGERLGLKIQNGDNL